MSAIFKFGASIQQNLYLEPGLFISYHPDNSFFYGKFSYFSTAEKLTTHPNELNLHQWLISIGTKFRHDENGLLIAQLDIGKLHIDTQELPQPANLKTEENIINVGLGIDHRIASGFGFSALSKININASAIQRPFTYKADIWKELQL